MTTQNYYAGLDRRRWGTIRCMSKRQLNFNCTIPEPHVQQEKWHHIVVNRNIRLIHTLDIWSETFSKTSHLCYWTMNFTPLSMKTNGSFPLLEITPPNHKRESSFIMRNVMLALRDVIHTQTGHCSILGLKICYKMNIFSSEKINLSPVCQERNSFTLCFLFILEDSVTTQILRFL